MQNSRQTNARQTVAANAELSTDDENIDGLLQTLSSSVKGILAPDEHNARYSPTNEQFARLRDRTSHIANNLDIAVNEIREQQHLLDEDRYAAGQFAAEMVHWNRVMDQLEQCANSWPNFPGPCSEVEAPVAGAADGCSPDDLLHALTQQDDKIRALEEELNDLKQEQKNASPPTIDPYVNRVIVATIGNETHKYPLTENFTTIGRHPQNDIQLPTNHVSRFHARIINDADSAYIVDLNSANGIMVNSDRANRQKLRSGDTIVIGRTQLKYIDLMEGTPGEGRA
jgi:hypothetical protein